MTLRAQYNSLVNDSIPIPIDILRYKFQFSISLAYEK